MDRVGRTMPTGKAMCRGRGTRRNREEGRQKGV